MIDCLLYIMKYLTHSTLWRIFISLQVVLILCTPVSEGSSNVLHRFKRDEDVSDNNRTVEVNNTTTNATSNSNTTTPVPEANVTSNEVIISPNNTRPPVVTTLSPLNNTDNNVTDKPAPSNNETNIDVSGNGNNTSGENNQTTTTTIPISNGTTAENITSPNVEESEREINETGGNTTLPDNFSTGNGTTDNTTTTTLTPEDSTENVTSTDNSTSGVDVTEAPDSNNNTNTPTSGQNDTVTDSTTADNNITANSTESSVTDSGMDSNFTTEEPGIPTVSENVTAENKESTIPPPPTTPADPCAVANCDHVCSKSNDAATCSCREGYYLGEDGKSCSDIDECSLKAPPCGQEDGQYCQNKEGTYDCLCLAGYIKNNSHCVSAPKKFKGQIEVESVKITDAEKLEWTSEMANDTSEVYMKALQAVEAGLKTFFMNAPGFVSVMVTSLRHASILAEYEVFFDESGPENITVVENLLETSLEGVGCSMATSSLCDIGNFQGLNSSMIKVQAYNACAQEKDNNCDGITTSCSANPDGTFSCTCNEGYKEWPASPYVCVDINECEANTHNCNQTTSTCVNNVGSFECNCTFGYIKKDGKCEEACNPNPCKNEGRCVKKQGDYECRCEGIWTGKDCDEEHKAAMRYKMIAVVVGALMGVLCFVLLVGFLFACCRWVDKI